MARQFLFISHSLITSITFSNVVSYVIESGYMHSMSDLWEEVRPTVDDAHSQTTGFSFCLQCNPTSASFQPQSAPAGEKAIHQIHENSDHDNGVDMIVM